MYLHLDEPKQENYIKIMDLAFKYCNSFAFIRHSQLFYHQSIDLLLDELHEEFIESKEQTEWPGTISVHPATVYYFKTTDKAKDLITKACKSLFDWKAPYLPDDLCFFRNGKEWLINTVHERFCAIKTDEEEIANEIKKLVRLVL